MVKSTDERRRPVSSVRRKNMPVKAQRVNEPQPNLLQSVQNKTISKSMCCFFCVCESVVSYFRFIAKIPEWSKQENVTLCTPAQFEANACIVRHKFQLHQLIYAA